MYNYSLNNIINAMKVRAYNKPFYANDLGLNGGEINGLKINHFIKPTGNTRKVIVPIDFWYGDRVFKECEVKEWVWCQAGYDGEYGWQDKALIQAIKEAKELLNLANEIGIEGF